MTDELLREALNALNVVAYQPGEYESLRHIDYCRWCHYARSHPHGDECIITRIDAYLATGGQDVAEKVREKCIEAAHDHECQTYAECCDCRGAIVQDIRALDLKELTK